MTNRRSPLTLASSLTVLVLDWSVYAVTMATLADALWPAMAVGAALTLLCVTLFEYRDHATMMRALSMGLLAAVCVAAPLPLLGSALALAAIAWRVAEKRHLGAGS